MYGYIIVLALLVTACGTESEIDPSLEPYLNEYLSLCDASSECKSKPRHTVDVLKIGEFANGNLGYCERNKTLGGTDRIVTIVPRGEYGEFQYKTLVFHELGHCIHGLKHDSESWIMDTSRKLASERVYEVYWEQALTQLFGR